MNDLIAFLTTKEIMAVYLISGVACFICLMVYVYEKGNERIRRKHNTKELNKLVEEVRERMPVEEETITYEEPVLEPIELEPIKIEPIEVLDEGYSVSEMLEFVSSKEEVVEEPIVLNKEEEELEYTTIEPDQETARLELERLTKALEEQEKREASSLSLYEEEQEASAIISMDELVNRAKEIYQSNETVQYEDEGNEPISIRDLEERIALQNKVEEVKEEKVEVKVEPIARKKEEVSRFKSTPFISPIFGIEKNPNDNELQLENTANYEKLDEQIKKSNEFVMSLKEFQSNLD